MAIGALLGAALMVAVRELAVGVEPVAIARDASDDTIASIEHALRADDRALRKVDPLRLDWLTTHTVLEPAPDWAATRAALDEWEQAARSVTGLRVGKPIRVDEATTAAYWERILGALQQEAGVRFDLTPLTPRQLGAWLLARRARVLRYRGNFKGAERDLLLARQIFPVNRAMFLQLVQLLDHRGPHVLGNTAWDIYQSRERQRMTLAGANRVPTTPEQVMQFNQANQTAGFNPQSAIRNPQFPALPAGLQR